MVVWSTVVFIVLLIGLWTIPVLSAVFTDSGSHEISSNYTNKNSTSEIVNHTSVDTKNVNMSEPGFYSKDILEEEGRKKKQPDIMTRIIPMLIIPFMLQTAIIPMMLMMLKMMLIKSAFIGKMAILLGFINMFRVANNRGGVYTHNIHLGHEQMPEHLASEHYGYKGDEEYGAYVNRKKRNNR